MPKRKLVQELKIPSEIRENLRVKSAEWRAQNPGVRQSKTNYYATHTFKAKARGTAYYHGNKEKYVGYRHKRRSLEFMCEGVFDSADTARIFRQQNGMCAYCEERDNLHLDHKTPVSRAGSNWPSNLQYLCQFHNLSKWTKTDAEYRAVLLSEGFNVRTPE